MAINNRADNLNSYLNNYNEINFKTQHTFNRFPFPNSNILFSFLALLLISLLLFPINSHAVGFGEIKLYSHLNEPLDAEIELQGTESYDPERLVVTLASAQEFKRAGLERPFFLTQFRFVILRKGNHTYIHITSNDPIKQPYLDFLIDLTWPGGRIVRGYTMLLDPAPAGGGRIHERVGEAEDSSLLQDPEIIPASKDRNSFGTDPSKLMSFNDANITTILPPQSYGVSTDSKQFATGITSKSASSASDIFEKKPVDEKLQGVGIVAQGKNKPIQTGHTKAEIPKDNAQISATYAENGTNIPTFASPTHNASGTVTISQASSEHLNQNTLNHSKLAQAIRAASNNANANSQLYEPLFEPEKNKEQQTSVPITIVTKDGSFYNQEDMQNQDSNTSSSVAMGAVIQKGASSAHTDNLQNSRSRQDKNRINHNNDPQSTDSSNTRETEKETHYSGTIPTVLEINFNVKQMLLVVICLLMLFGGIVGTLQLVRRKKLPGMESRHDILSSMTNMSPQNAYPTHHPAHLNLATAGTNHEAISASAENLMESHNLGVGANANRSSIHSSMQGMQGMYDSMLSTESELNTQSRGIHGRGNIGFSPMNNHSFGTTIPDISIAALQSEAEKIYRSLYGNNANNINNSNDIGNSNSSTINNPDSNSHLFNSSFSDSTDFDATISNIMNSNPSHSSPPLHSLSTHSSDHFTSPNVGTENSNLNSHSSSNHLINESRELLNSIHSSTADSRTDRADPNVLHNSQVSQNSIASSHIASSHKGVNEEVGLKINLARQYLDLGDRENAMHLLDKILAEGSDSEKEIARQLLLNYQHIGN